MMGYFSGGSSLVHLQGNAFLSRNTDKEVFIKGGYMEKRWGTLQVGYFGGYVEGYVDKCLRGYLDKKVFVEEYFDWVAFLGYRGLS